MGGGASTESRRLSAPFHIALPIVGELPTVDGDRHLTVCLEQNTVLYIHAASFQLLPPPASATETRRRVLVRLYNIGAHEFPTCWSAEVCEDGSGVVSLPCINQAARLLRIELLAAAPSATIAELNVRAERCWRDTLLDSFEAAFKFHGPKPLCGRRSDETAAAAAGDPRAEFAWSTYDTVWQRATRFAKGLHALICTWGVSSGAGVGIMAGNSEEWLVAQFGCWMLGRHVVALATNLSAAHLANMLAQAKTEVLITDRVDVVVPAAVRLLVTIGAAGAVSPAAAAARSGVNAADVPDRYAGSFAGVEASGLELASQGLPRLPRACEDRRALVLFTSGSSGTPKGVARTFRDIHRLVKTHSVPQHNVHLSVQPLSHLSESSILPTIILRGGSVGFSTTAGGSGGHLDLLGDMRALQPTVLFSVPRFFDIAHNLFDDTVRRFISSGKSLDDARLEATNQFRSQDGPFGGRLCVVSVGSAPVTPQLLSFLSETWGLTHGGTAVVSQGYGSTECGAIAADGKVYHSAKVLLVERPDLNASLSATRPRGELLVNTPQIVQQYESAGDAKKSSTGYVVDGVPYFRTGDLCETDREGYESSSTQGTCEQDCGSLAGQRYVLLQSGASLDVVGRAKHCQKLSNGEFVSPEAIETALAGIDPGMVNSFMIKLDVPNDRVVALVVPHDLLLAGSVSAEAALQQEFVKMARSAGLAAYETPAQVAILSEKWNPQSGTMTSSNKVDRSGIERRFAADLQRIGVGGRDSESKAALGDGSGHGSAKQSIDTYVCNYLGAPTEEEADAALLSCCAGGCDLSSAATLADIGGDSIMAARVAGSFTDKLTIVQVVSLPLAELRKRVQHGTPPEKEHTDVHTAEFWTAEADCEWSLPASTAASDDGAKILLLTGVTGFIGPVLLAALAQHGRWQKIVALVRPPLERVNVALDLPAGVEIQLVAADLSQQGLGITEQDMQLLRTISFDTVVHSAARVDHILSYEQLKPSNVDACDELVRLVSPSKPRFVFVSSLSAACHGAAEDLISTPAEAVTAGLGGGYGQTKWVAERRLEQAREVGLLRSLCIVRLGLVGPHSVSGAANRHDVLHLCMRAISAIKAAPLMPVGQSIEMLAVDAAVAIMTTLAATDHDHDRDHEDETGGTSCVVHLDAEAAGAVPCPMDKLVSAASCGNAVVVLPYDEWYSRVREAGRDAARALAVLPLPSPAGQPDGAFTFPSASRGDLERGLLVAKLCRRLWGHPGEEGNHDGAAGEPSAAHCLRAYVSDEFYCRWAGINQLDEAAAEL
jgi:fatty acid CoA ligase FadD9